MQESWIQYLGWEDPLEKGMATHSSILAWRISSTEEPGGPQPMGSQRVWRDWATNTHKLICLYFKKINKKGSGLIHVDVLQKPSQYCKVTILQLK